MLAIISIFLVVLGLFSARLFAKDQTTKNLSILPSNVFFIVSSQSASIFNTGESSVLILHGINPHTLYFTAAPDRDSGFVKTSEVFKDWHKLFLKGDPNAALSHLDLKGTDLYGHNHAMSFEVGAPYKTKLGNHAFKIKTLKGDSFKPGEYTDVNLFLDPVVETVQSSPE